MFFEKKKNFFALIANFILFFIVLGLVLSASFPMWFYAYRDYDYLAKVFLIIVYILIALSVAFISLKIDRNRTKVSGFWFEKRNPIGKKWFISLFVFGCLFFASNVLQGILVDYLKLETPLNQMAIESELENFPIKSWLYIHLAFVGPILEELTFRKVFMDLFFRKDTFLYNFLAIFSSGMIFGILHEPKLSWFLLFYSISGWVLAFIYRYTRDIRLPICIHLSNNLLSLLASLLV